MEPKPIDPQDIRVGMRVRREDERAEIRTTHEFIVAAVRDGFLDGPHCNSFPLADCTWTLLADAPKPERAVGSKWRDPKNNICYIVADDGAYLPYTYREQSLDCLDESVPSDAEEIARLTPIPAFDPATLWPAIVGYGPRCGERNGVNTLSCSRPYGHDSLHAAYAGHKDGVENLRYVWGDPR